MDEKWRKCYLLYNFYYFKCILIEKYLCFFSRLMYDHLMSEVYVPFSCIMPCVLIDIYLSETICDIDTRHYVLCINDKCMLLFFIYSQLN